MYKEYNAKIILPESVSRIVDNYAAAFTNVNQDATYQNAIDEIFTVSLLERVVQICATTAELNNRTAATDEEKAEVLKALIDAYAVLELSAANAERENIYRAKKEWAAHNYNVIKGSCDYEE